MTLSARLKTFQDGMYERIGPENAAIIRSAIDLLLASDLANRPLRQGEQAPDFELPDQHGRSISLANRLTAGPVALSFYRGGWSPTCELTLRAWQAELGGFRRAGVSVLAISPDDQAAAVETATSNWIDFSLLSDVGNATAAAYGLDYEMPPDVQKLYQRFNAKIGKRCCTWRVPMCATYVIAPDRTILSAMASVNSVIRMDPKEVLRAVQIARWNLAA